MNALDKVEVAPGLKVSKALADKWPLIAKTEREFISIKATPNPDAERTGSHFGYYPYLPKGFDYPVDEHGKPMLPLAQLNFAEMPHLKGYPEKGILQFYIADSDIYGLDFDDPFNPQASRIVYFENPDLLQPQEDIAFLKPIIYDNSSPVFVPHSLSFSLEKEYIGLEDVACQQNDVFNIYDYIESLPGDIKEQVETEAYELFMGSGHKVGGYAYFTQSDPRAYDDKLSGYKLLFQMDTDEQIMWGDAGVGNFFIHPDALAEKDFSRVMYNWDCS